MCPLTDTTPVKDVYAAVDIGAGFESWLHELTDLATEDQILWLLDPTGAAHYSAFANGLSPFDEIQSLHQISEWKGCGCTGN